MRTVHTFRDARALGSGCVGLVPTMGYLHEGHTSLVDAARRECDTVIVSLFVNPLQFAPTEDLTSYPRLGEMYPDEPLTTVSVGLVTEGMEGGIRPGHFDGVATVVAKLFAGIAPDRAYFGRKDAQQLVTVRRMTTDLSFPIVIVGEPIVRESDGLALSSRNTYLDRAERAAARSINRGINAVAEAIIAGERSATELERIAAAPVNDESGVDLDYATLADQDTAFALLDLDRPAFLAVAARVGRTRLLDNVHIDRIDGGWVPDVGIRLDGPSILYREA